MWRERFKIKERFEEARLAKLWLYNWLSQAVNDPTKTELTRL